MEKLAALTSEVDALDKAMGAAAKDLDLVRKRKDSIAPEAIDKQIANVLRDFPGSTSSAQPQGEQGRP